MVGGFKPVFGVTPGYGDLNWDGLDFSPAQFDTVTRFDKAAWLSELKLHDELFDQLAHHLPVELQATKTALAHRLAA